MTQQLHTRCPHCASAFRFEADLLDQANGRAKCGDCQQIFNAAAWLVDVPSDINGQLESIVDQYQLDALTELGSPSQGLGDLDLSADFSFTAKDAEAPQPEPEPTPQRTEPRIEPTLDAQPEPQIEPEIITQPEPEPVIEPVIEPEPVIESVVAPEPVTESEISEPVIQETPPPQPKTTPQAEPVPVAAVAEEAPAVDPQKEQLAARSSGEVKAKVGPGALDQTDLDFSLSAAPEDISDDLVELVNQPDLHDQPPSLGQVDELSNDEAEALFSSDPPFAESGDLKLEDEELILDEFDRLTGQDDLQPAAAPVARPVSAKNRQRNEERDKVLEQLMSEKTAKKRSGARSVIWLVLAVAIVVVGAGEWIWLQRDTFAHQENRRPWLENMCAVIGCEVPTYRNLNKIAISNRDMRSHPEDPQGLQLNALLTNRAQWHQHLPNLDLSFSDTKQNVIAQRSFTPKEYLRDKGLLNKLMKPGLPVQIQLELKDPGEAAVNFELKLTEPEHTTLF